MEILTLKQRFKDWLQFMLFLLLVYLAAYTVLSIAILFLFGVNEILQSSSCNVIQERYLDMIKDLFSWAIVPYLIMGFGTLLNDIFYPFQKQANRLRGRVQYYLDRVTVSETILRTTVIVMVILMTLLIVLSAALTDLCNN